jgi:predicted RNase H-like HicB family nuclease
MGDAQGGDPAVVDLAACDEGRLESAAESGPEALALGEEHGAGLGSSSCLDIQSGEGLETAGAVPWKGLAPEEMTMRTFTVRYERDETGWWVAQVLEEPAALSQGRSIAQARRRVREALALLLDDEGAARRAVFTDQVHLPNEARRAVRRARAARNRLDAQARRASEATALAVRLLTNKLHVSVRDASELLELSHQRVHQVAQGR